MPSRASAPFIRLTIWHVNGATQDLGKAGTYANSNIIDSGGAQSEFANFNPATLTYDVLLKAGAPAICAGTAGPPTVDFLGVTRQRQASCTAGTPGYAAGAYAYPM
jgi:hypothetical protein